MTNRDVMKTLLLFPPDDPCYVNVSVPDGVFIGPVQAISHDPETGIHFEYEEGKKDSEEDEDQAGDPPVLTKERLFN
jgi:hypothetical protein